MAATAHILFPFDFSTQAAQTAPFVAALARHLDARITLYSVMPPALDSAPAELSARIGDDPAEWRRVLQGRLDHALVAELAGLRTDRVADSGDPAMRIVGFADQHGVDLIMMPTHGHSLFRRLLVGSVTARVLHEAKCPVWTAAHALTQRPGGIPKSILCAVDGTPETLSLVGWGRRFSRDCGATLTLLHVVTPVTDIPELERERLRQDRYRQMEHARVESLLRDAGVDAPLHTAVGDIVSTVEGEAQRQNVDLVLIGRGQLAEPFGRLRTHVSGIIQRSPCPVVSVNTAGRVAD